MNENDDRLIEQVHGLKGILNVAQVVVSSLELDEVLQNILHSAMAVIDMPAGSIALYNACTYELELHAHAGLSDNFISHDRWRVKPGGLTHEILERGELFIINDTTKADFFNNPLAIKEGIQALIAIPLKIHKRTIGVLYLDDFQPREFLKEKLELLSILASFATMSIDHARLYERTQQLACTDGLTGLYNHRQFKKMFAEEVARACRYNKSLSIILFDVDDFKKFNDTYGHPADRIRIFVETESPRFLTQITKTRGVTVSVGVAAVPDDGNDAAGLLKTVDDLMYKAKNEGKNKVYSNER
jgi:PleD family two-component response regulator